MIMWRYPSNDHGENKGINDSGVSTFKGTPLKSLAREICQNSLDATRGGTVKIEFSKFTIPTSSIPGVADLEDAFTRCKDFWNVQKDSKTREFFGEAIKKIQMPYCDILRISDFNTTGLLGSKQELNTDWINLTKSSGASDKKGTAGGSYGIGKYAPFACSYFSTVFYSTYDEDEQEAYQGVSRIVTFRRSSDNETTQGIGYYGEEKNTPVYRQLELDTNFKRQNSDYGTDIYICGYKFAGDDWEKKIIISILDGFLVAIWNEKLVVEVGEKIVSKQTLPNLIDEYKEELTGNTEKYYDLLSSKNTNWMTKNLSRFGDVKLGLLFGDPDAPRRVAMIRKTGMKIFEKDRLPSHIPFTGIMFLEGDKLNERLRLIENPEHTEWQPERSPTPAQEREILKQLYSFIKDKITELVMQNSEEEIDAAGVGNFLPDENNDKEQKSIEEVISDKVIDVQKKFVKNNVIVNQKENKSNIEGLKTLKVHKELNGDEEDWLHYGKRDKKPKPRNPQPTHYEEGGNDKKEQIIEMNTVKFTSICVNKKTGSYVLVLIPDDDTENGILQVFLSAETQKYEAPILSAVLVAGTESRPLKVENGYISGIPFKKEEPIRIKIDIDYYDYCSMEVRIYELKK